MIMVTYLAPSLFYFELTKRGQYLLLLLLLVVVVVVLVVKIVKAFST